MTTLFALCLLLAGLVGSGQTANPGLNPDQVEHLFASMGLPLPCGSDYEAKYLFWGSTSSSGEWTIVGVNPGLRPRILAGDRCTRSSAYLLARGDRVLDLDGVRRACVSDSGTIAIVGGPQLEFRSHTGEPLGGSTERFVVFRCGAPDGIAGFLPGSELFIRAGAVKEEDQDGNVVRCLRTDGSEVWEYEAEDYVRAVVLTRSGCLEVCLATKRIRLSLEGEAVSEFEADPPGNEEVSLRYLLRSN